MVAGFNRFQGKAMSVKELLETLGQNHRAIMTASSSGEATGPIVNGVIRRTI
jgi:hypothetical protein